MTTAKRQCESRDLPLSRSRAPVMPRPADLLGRLVLTLVLTVAMALLASAQLPAAVAGQQPAEASTHMPGGEVNSHLPDLHQGDFLGMTGHQILLSGLVV